jgi:MoxR-like ATPase
MANNLKEKMDENKKERSKNLNGIAESIQNMIFDHLLKVDSDEIFELVLPEVKERIRREIGPIPEIHKIETPLGEHKVTGITHEKFDQVLSMVYNNIPAYLAGPAGAGKNVICKQVAEGLGLDFYFTNAVTQEYKLTGFVDANGNYQDTQFFKAFTKGGLFFLDEMDASIPEVLVILNAAIANRYFDFPKHGKVEAHKDFRVIAAGNTLGTGANSDYTGRYCLDRASLDRFALIDIDYSPKIEAAITDNDTQLVEFCHAFRNIVDKSGIQCLFSYRSLERIHKLSQDKSLSMQDIYNISLLKGLDKDDVVIIKAELGKLDDKIKNLTYTKEFLKIPT